MPVDNLKLTANQKKTYDKIMNKDYDGLTKNNVTMLMRKLLPHEDSINKAMPNIIDYNKSVSEGKTEDEVIKQMIKSMRIADDKNKLREITGFTKGKSKTKKVEFDKSKNLDEVLDEINNKDVEEPKRSDDSGMGEARQKKLGEDGKGRPPIEKPKLMAMNKPTEKKREYDFFNPKQRERLNKATENAKRRIEELDRQADEERMIKKPINKIKKAYNIAKEKYLKNKGLNPEQEGKSYNLTKKMKDEINKLAKTEKGKSLIEKKREERWSQYDEQAKSEFVGIEYPEKKKSWFEKKYNKYVEGYDSDDKTNWELDRFEKEEQKENIIRFKYLDEYDVLNRKLTDEQRLINEQFEADEKNLDLLAFEKMYTTKNPEEIEIQVKREKADRYKKLNEERRERFKPLVEMKQQYEIDEEKRAYEDIARREQESGLFTSKEDAPQAPQAPAPLIQRDPAAPRASTDRSSSSSWQGGNDEYKDEKFQPDPTRNKPKQEREKGAVVPSKNKPKKHTSNPFRNFTKRDYENFQKAIESGGKSVKQFMADAQNSLADMTDQIKSGERQLGQRLNNSNDPFGILRGLGYTYTGQVDTQALGRSAISAGVGGVVTYATGSQGAGEFFGMLAGKASDWLFEIGKENRDTSFTPDDLKGGVYGEDGELIVNRTDQYYRPNWTKYDYIPNEKMGKYFKGQQDVYLEPIKMYIDALNARRGNILNDLSPEQYKYLQSLNTLYNNIKLGTANLTHLDYKNLIKNNRLVFRDIKGFEETNEKALQQFKDIYNYNRGAAANDPSLTGDVAPFADDFIEDVDNATDDTLDFGDDEGDFDEGDEGEGDEGDGDEGDDGGDGGDGRTPPEKQEEDEFDGYTPPKRTFTTFDDEPKYRPRGQWGNTDELFEITESDKQKRNIIIETATLNDGIDRASNLYKKQQIQYNNRYGRTAPMPRAYNYTPKTISQEWQRKSNIAMISGNAPMARNFYDTAHDPYMYGQFSQFQPRDNWSVHHQDNIENPLVYPDVVNVMNNGGYMIEPDRAFNNMEYIMNQRFTNH